MFDKILETAHEAGAEILVQKSGIGMEVNLFFLFHIGISGRAHWGFKLGEITFVYMKSYKIPGTITPK